MANQGSLPRNGLLPVFHPPEERTSARQERIGQAKAICRTCPAIKECLAHALNAQEPYGIWGGRSEDERAALLGVESLRYPKKNPVLNQLKS